MSTWYVVVGVDPGMTSGIALLVWRRVGPEDVTFAGAEFAQVSHDLTLPVVDMLLGQNRDRMTYLAIERFVVGKASMRAGRAGEITRTLIGQLSNGRVPSDRLHLRSAADVKPWATDIRLAHAGLMVPTKGMPHARDAARHALFASFRIVAPDPLSRSFRKAT